MSNLDVNATVADWVKEFPPTSRIFERFQIDYCCGGGNTLSQACADRQLDANEIVAEFARRLAASGMPLDRFGVYSTMIDPQLPGRLIYWTPGAGIRINALDSAGLQGPLWVGSPAEVSVRTFSL